VGNDTSEIPSFVPVGGDAVFAVAHLPTGSPRGGFLFCHPLAEEKLWAHRVCVSFARRLARAGWTVVRIDFRGEGDSHRSFEGTDVLTRLDDVRAGLAVLRRYLPETVPVGLLGLRFGAALAAAVAAEPGSAVNRLVLWDPVIKGAPYMQSVLMANLAHQMALHRRVVEDRKALVERMRAGETVNIEGYEMSFPLFEQACAIDFSGGLPTFSGRGLVVQIGPAGVPVRRDLSAFAAGCPDMRLAQVEEEPFWKETKFFCHRAEWLENLTLQWLEESA